MWIAKEITHTTGGTVIMTCRSSQGGASRPLTVELTPEIIKQIKDLDD